MSDIFFIREIAYIGVLQGAPRNPLDTMRASQTMEELWGGYTFGSMSMCSFCGDWLERAHNNFHYHSNDMPEAMIAPLRVQHARSVGWLRRIAVACCSIDCPSFQRYFCEACDVHHIMDEYVAEETCTGQVCSYQYDGYHSDCGCNEYDDDDYDGHEGDIKYNGEPVIRCRTCNTTTTNFDYIREIWCCSCRIPMPNPTKETV